MVGNPIIPGWILVAEGWIMKKRSRSNGELIMVPKSSLRGNIHTNDIENA